MRQSLQLFGRADVNRRRNDVVARLPHVDVIVRVNRLARADRFAGQLRAAIGDHFVGVRVRARAGTGLKNVEREMLVELALHHFLRRLDDERAARSASSKPRSWLAWAAAHLIKPSARMNGREKR